MEISKRILIVTPEKRKDSLTEKLKGDNISEILSYGDWNEDLIENQIKNFSKEKNIPLKKIIMPLRYLIFGNLKGPSLFTSIALIGRKTIINRINLALKTFKF